MPQHIKDNIERVLGAHGDFSMRQLADTIWPLLEELPSISEVIPQLRRTLGSKYRKVAESIIRHAFLLELVKTPKIETTKFRYRWTSLLAGDPRVCTFNECLQIAERLTATLPSWVQTPVHLEALNLALCYGCLPYEIPLDYHVKITEDGCLHKASNINWHFDETLLRTLKLRKFLIEPSTSPDPTFFKRVLVGVAPVSTGHPANDRR